MFRGFTEANVLRIAAFDKNGSWARMQMLPSYEVAMSHSDLSHEVFALLPVHVEPTAIRMSKEEVSAMITGNSKFPVSDETEVPGLQGVSPFMAQYNL